MSEKTWNRLYKWVIEASESINGLNIAITTLYCSVYNTQCCNGTDVDWDYE